MGKNLSNKCSQKLLDIAKKSRTDAIKIASKRAIQKTVEATGDLIGSKNKITSVSKKSTKELSNDETEVDVARATPKKRYITQEERQQIIGELRFNNIIMEYQKIENLLDHKIVLNASNKPSKFRTRNWIGIKDEIRGAYSPNKQIRFYVITVIQIYLLKEI